MNIDKSSLQYLWYEDKSGNKVEVDINDITSIERNPEIAYLVSRFPLEIRTKTLKIIRQADVDECRHKKKYIKHTFGWVKGTRVRECQKCYGTQVRKWWQLWGRKWVASGSKEVSIETTHLGSGSEKIILAMVNSGDYTLSEAILIVSRACERCSNVLAYKYTNKEDGYPEGSKDWFKSKTSCKFCRDINPEPASEGTNNE